MDRPSSAQLRCDYKELQTATCLASRYGTSVSTVSRWLKDAGVVVKRGAPHGHMGNLHDVTGRDFGTLTVKSYDAKAREWVCECSCGRQRRVRYSSRLTNGHITTCGHSVHQHGKKHTTKGWKHRICPGYWYQLKHAASERGLAFEITPEEAWAVFVAQDGCCAFNGSLIVVKTRSCMSKDEWDASLDRIDSTNGYVVGNVQWVHKKYQYMKRNMQDKDFIQACCDVADHVRGGM